jgi:HPt (histidine-containing phosphotransfer) domain-containing protein
MFNPGTSLPPFEPFGDRMTASSGLLDFFTLEAGEYLEHMDALLASAGDRGPDADAFARHARALRGSATMARLGDLAEVATGVERAAVALRTGSLQWRPPVSDAIVGAVRDLRVLVGSVREWGDDARRLARSRADELARATSAAAPGPVATHASRGPIVPIARLFVDDEGPHVLHRAPNPPTSADVRFRAAAVPVASELRRVIAIARREDASSPAAHLTAGADVRSALRDLRELAESYDVRPVVAFAAAREAAVELLDERALATVDAAAAAIVESASGGRGRVTPVPTPGRAAERSAPSPAAETAGPASGHAPPQAAADPGVSGAAQAVPAAPVAEPGLPALPAEPSAPPPPDAESDAMRDVEPATVRGDRPTPGVPWPTTAPESMPAVLSRRTPSVGMTPTPTGPALRALLEDSIQGMSLLAEQPFGEHEAPGTAADRDGVSIDRLLYRGRAALERARQLRDVIRREGGAPRAEALAELFDLLDLAATESPPE